ncbi:hypothetical protein M2139_002037 [Enterococcus sp. PF1-24]|uniref:helix-turn-helix domain-containing protein n=1 Tax=unclassified Enterococcus TaxID=2608891 RepID=UPI002476AF3B|nr:MULTISPECIES: helix-turn-helix domain-containing protein [unclassified Enterococcus]MDH6365090.1 hypothetical protein [Enterococcus sp. PFB1-1]MDH6402137.1 hypothetical protein [Enterococcus sp. PF1-24]
MEIILSTAMHRRIELLNILSTAKSWLHLDKLARAVDASKKTVMSDCQYLEDRWPHILTIETSKKDGVRLLEANNRSVHDIYVEMIRESTTFSLLEGVFFEPNRSSEYWEKKLFLSASSLYRATGKLNNALQNRNMELNRSPFQLVSEDERVARYFFSSYFLEVYGIHEWSFAVPKQTVIKLAMKMNQDFNLRLNDSQMVELAFLIVVTLYREQQGWLITNVNFEDPLYRERVEKMKRYEDEIQEILDSMGVVIDTNLGSDFTYSIFWWEFGWDNPQERIRIDQLATNFTNILTDVLNVPLSEENLEKIVLLFEYVYAKHKMYPYKKYIVYNRTLFSSVGLQQSFVLYTKVVEKTLKEKEKKYKFPWYSMYYEEILDEVLIRWDNLAEDLVARRPQIKIGVFSDLGIDHAKLLANLVGRHLYENVEVVVQNRPFHEVNRYTFPDLEFYVSNFNIEGIPEEKLFIVEDFPSFKNQLDLRRRIDDRRLSYSRKIPYLLE